MSRIARFAESLEDMGIDPIKWENAREGNAEFAEFRLAKEIEEIILDDIKTERGIPLHAVTSVAGAFYLAAAYWPLEPDDALTADRNVTGAAPVRRDLPLAA